jgi:hypothetical protein
MREDGTSEVSVVQVLRMQECNFELERKRTGIRREIKRRPTSLGGTRNNLLELRQSRATGVTLIPPLAAVSQR